MYRVRTYTYPAADLQGFGEKRSHLRIDDVRPRTPAHLPSALGGKQGPQEEPDLPGYSHAGTKSPSEGVGVYTASYSWCNSTHITASLSSSFSPTSHSSLTLSSPTHLAELLVFPTPYFPLLTLPVFHSLTLSLSPSTYSPHPSPLTPHPQSSPPILTPSLHTTHISLTRKTRT